MPVLTKKLLLFFQQDPSPNEVARYLTLMGLVDPSPRAATLSAIYDDGSIYEIARFGLSGKDPFMEKNPIWQKFQPFKHLRANEFSLINPRQVLEQVSQAGMKIEMDPWLKSVLLIPISKKDVPMGALALFFDEEFESIPHLEIDFESLQALFVLAFRTPQFAYSIAKKANGALPELTDQELLLLNLIARGHSNKHIAGKTQLALSTVKARVSRLLRTFDVANRKQLIEASKKLNLPTFD